MATAILDIDGTLVDTNYQHAIAWYRAFHRHGIVLPVWRIHRHVGMGGDQLVSALCDDEVEERQGDDIRDSEKDLYMELIDEIEPLAGARDLVRDLKDRGCAVVLASSAKPDEVERYIDELDARELADGWTTSGDVEATKPEPDLVKAALEKARERRGDQAGDTPLEEDTLLIGDSVWDCQSAGRAGIEAVGVLTGGFAESELREAGATAVFHSIEELRDRLDELPRIGDA